MVASKTVVSPHKPSAFFILLATIPWKGISVTVFVEMMPKYFPHSWASTALRRILERVLALSLVLWLPLTKGTVVKPPSRMNSLTFLDKVLKNNFGTGLSDYYFSN